MKKIGYKKMVDPITGELQTFILIGHDFEDTDFVKLPFVSLELIMDDKDLAKSAMRLLSFIIRHKITFSNYTFALSYEYDIKGNLEMSEKQYHNAINKLIKKDLLIKIGRGRFMLNPRRIRYGRADQLRKFEEQYDKIKKAGDEDEN